MTFSEGVQQATDAPINLYIDSIQARARPVAVRVFDTAAIRRGGSP